MICLGSGFALAINTKNQFPQLLENSKSLIPSVNEISPSPAPETPVQDFASPSPTSNAKLIIEVSPQPSKTPTSNFSAYIYPGSTIVGQSDSKITLESSTDTMQIVDWYKQVLQSENAQIHNTVVNTVNGNTTATMTISSHGNNMYVTITHNSLKTSISIEKK